jgi:site-specific recombinase XerD
MIDAMRQRGFAARTHQSYLAAVSDLARHYRRSPDQLDVDQLQAYFKYLAIERELSGASCRLYLNAVRFLYREVLQWPAFEVPLIVPKRAQRIPELLTRAEVARILDACANLKHRMLLETGYGCGLRVSELVRLRVRHIDGERRQLRIDQGKGAKDRVVPLSVRLLERLRAYYRHEHPVEWLFPNSQQRHRPVGISTAQKVFLRAKRHAGVEKVGGIHSLRHAYATHQLENGLPVHQLQHLLGHRNLQSTMRYVHWLPGRCAPAAGMRDLLADLEGRHG